MSVFGSGVSAGTIYANLKLNSTMDKDVKTANKSLDSIATKFAAVGVAGAVAAGAIAAKFVQMAAAEEVVSRRTSALLKAQGIMWEDVNVSLDTYLKGIERLTSYNDTDLQEAFNTLLVSGMTYTEAMDTMNTVTSMSYSLNRDLVSMAMLVGKAYNGQTGELSRYGIVLDQNLDKAQKFEALQGYVNTNFADASERTGTLSGQMDVLRNSMFNVAEEIGVELMPELMGHLEDLNAWGDDGGWKATADALSLMADLLSNMATSAGYVKEAYDIISDGYTLTTADKDSPEYQAAWSRARHGQDFEGVDFEGTNFGLSGGLLQDPTALSSLATPSPAVTGTTGGSIPAWAGHGKQLQEYYGSTPSGYGSSSMSVYSGTTSTSASGSSGESAVSMLSSINTGIAESIKVQKEIISAVNNIKITSRRSGGFGRGGSSNSSPTATKVKDWANTELAKQFSGAFSTGGL